MSSKLASDLAVYGDHLHLLPLVATVSIGWGAKPVFGDFFGSRHFSKPRRHVQCDRNLDIRVAKGSALRAAGLEALMSMWRMTRVKTLTGHNMEHNLHWEFL